MNQFNKKLFAIIYINISHISEFNLIFFYIFKCESKLKHQKHKNATEIYLKLSKHKKSFKNWNFAKTQTFQVLR